MKTDGWQALASQALPLPIADAALGGAALPKCSKQMPWPEQLLLVSVKAIPLSWLLNLHHFNNMTYCCLFGFFFSFSLSFFFFDSC